MYKYVHVHLGITMLKSIQTWQYAIKAGISVLARLFLGGSAPPGLLSAPPKIYLWTTPLQVLYCILQHCHFTLKWLWTCKLLSGNLKPVSSTCNASPSTVRHCLEVPSLRDIFYLPLPDSSLYALPIRHFVVRVLRVPRRISHYDIWSRSSVRRAYKHVRTASRGSSCCAVATK